LSYLENQVVGLKKIDFPDTLKQGVKKIDVKTVFINEPGLYSLIMRSKSPQAIEFQKWVYAGFKNGGVFTIFSAFQFTLENRGCFHDFFCFSVNP
jgi:hypothetical protein